MVIEILAEIARQPVLCEWMSRLFRFSFRFLHCMRRQRGIAWNRWKMQNNTENRDEIPECEHEEYGKSKRLLKMWKVSVKQGRGSHTVIGSMNLLDLSIWLENFSLCLLNFLHFFPLLLFVISLKSTATKLNCSTATVKMQMNYGQSRFLELFSNNETN